MSVYAIGISQLTYFCKIYASGRAKINLNT